MSTRAKLALIALAILIGLIGAMPLLASATICQAAYECSIDAHDFTRDACFIHDLTVA